MPEETWYIRDDRPFAPGETSYQAMERQWRRPFTTEDGQAVELVRFVDQGEGQEAGTPFRWFHFVVAVPE